MNVVFKGSKLRKLANERKKLIRKYGPETAKVIGRRLDQLRAADSLDDLPKIGRGRCHELKGDRDGTLSLDLVHPLRLIFEPANAPIPIKDGGGLDWESVTSVRILEVTDTHE